MATTEDKYVTPCFIAQTSFHRALDGTADVQLILTLDIARTGRETHTIDPAVRN